jgi:hypothetical protein
MYQCVASIIVNDDQQDPTILAYLFIPSRLYMFRPIIRLYFKYSQTFSCNFNYDLNYDYSILTTPILVRKLVNRNTSNRKICYYSGQYQKL